jgi:regulator of telomere elongation helicase 1
VSKEQKIKPKIRHNQWSVNSRISGVPVEFPFEPYQVQTDYMSKVIECLEEGENGMLESPTGTGKTLSLLCSSLAWLQIQKAKFQANLVQINKVKTENGQKHNDPDPFDDFAASLGTGPGTSKSWGCPKIIYASRTHSQLTQAMQELKRTKYHYMKAAVLGSRDQMCINPEVQAETGNAAKTHMCRLKVLTRSCGFHSRVEKVKDSRDVQEAGIMDIEDLVKVGTKQRCCPYFLSRELIEQADIIFMPYNYLLDPKARRANKIELTNTIVILDEAHNVEKMCEESASIQIRSTDIALSIEDLTGIMKHMEKGQSFSMNSDEAKDFTMDDLATLKEVFLALERSVDDIQIKTAGGSTFEGAYIFELLEKANITHASAIPISGLLDKLIQFLTTVNENNAFGRKGANLQTIADLLTIVFVSSKGNEAESDYMQRIQKCFKVGPNS